MRKKFLCYFVLLAIFLVLFRQISSINEGIIKIARFNNNPKFNNYIICDNRLTTDAEWFMLVDECGVESDTWVNIVFKGNLKPPETEKKA